MNVLRYLLNPLDVLREKKPFTMHLLQVLSLLYSSTVRENWVTINTGDVCMVASRLSDPQSLMNTLYSLRSEVPLYFLYDMFGL